MCNPIIGLIGSHFLLQAINTTGWEFPGLQSAVSHYGPAVRNGGCKPEVGVVGLGGHRTDQGS